jgi:hypothetical protein
MRKYSDGARVTLACALYNEAPLSRTREAFAKKRISARTPAVSKKHHGQRRTGISIYPPYARRIHVRSRARAGRKSERRRGAGKKRAERPL